MVVEVFIAQGDADDPLGEQGLLVMHDDREPAGVGDDAVEGVEEPESLLEFPEQEGTGIGGDPTALEIGDDRLRTEGGKRQGVAVTLCQCGGLATWRFGELLIQILQGVRPPRHE